MYCDSTSRTRESQLRENQQVQRIHILRVRFDEDGIGAIQVIVDVSHLGGKLQAAYPHGSRGSVYPVTKGPAP